MSQYRFFHDAPFSSFASARKLRGNMTPTEQELWNHIRKNQIDGFRFRRQHPVAKFILDFCCHESKLAIELDGLVHEHEDQKQYDQERDYLIRELGIEVIRFKNDEVFENLPDVLNSIKISLKNRFHLLKSSPNGEDLGGAKGANS